MADYTLAYILSSPRSGSTLLDNLIACHPSAISLGEVHHLQAYVLDDRRSYNPRQPLVCTCGAKVPECTFWNAVQRDLDTPLAELALKSPVGKQGRIYLPRYRQLLAAIAAKIVFRYPGAYRNGMVRNLCNDSTIGADSFRLFDAVHEISATQCIVDSSKDAFRFRSLWRQRPIQVKGIVLCRDYRAVAYSMMRRGDALEAAVTSWTGHMRQIEEMTYKVPAERILRLTYESLCQAPDETMEKIWKFLGLGIVDTMLARPVGTLHHLGGSPSKFDENKRQIRLDTEFLHALPANDLSKLKRLAEPFARKWGYD